MSTGDKIGYIIIIVGIGGSFLYMLWESWKQR